MSHSLEVGLHSLARHPLSRHALSRHAEESCICDSYLLYQFIISTHCTDCKSRISLVRLVLNAGSKNDLKIACGSLCICIKW